MLKTYSLPLAIVYSLGLLIICLIKVDGIVEEVHIQNVDKIFHFFSFLVLALLWYLPLVYTFRLNQIKSIVNAFLVSVAFGIIIEILQGSFTANRQSDIKDVFADTLGALLMALILYSKNRIRTKKNKDLYF